MNMSRKISRERFIEKSKKLYGDDFNYNLVEYVNNETKVKIICNECSYLFERTPHHHLRGSIGCFNCLQNSKYSNTEDFIEKSMIIHKDRYDYSQVNYENVKKKVKIICKIHGPFKQQPNSHLSGHGCRKCVISNDQFIEKLKKIYGEKYDYSK